MSAYGAKEARINQIRNPKGFVCGSCGREISSTCVICAGCQSQEDYDETKSETATEQTQSAI